MKREKRKIIIHGREFWLTYEEMKEGFRHRRRENSKENLGIKKQNLLL